MPAPRCPAVVACRMNTAVCMHDESTPTRCVHIYLAWQLAALAQGLQAAPIADVPTVHLAVLRTTAAAGQLIISLSVARMEWATHH